MFIGLSVLKLQFARRSCSTAVKVGKYVGLVVCVMALGYITSRPALKCFYDATANKDRTITPNSQEILKKVDGGLTITSYVNLLDPTVISGCRAIGRTTSDLSSNSCASNRKSR